MVGRAHLFTSKQWQWGHPTRTRALRRPGLPESHSKKVPTAGTRRLGQGQTGTGTDRQGGRDVCAMAGAPAACRLLELEGAEDGRCLKSPSGGRWFSFSVWSLAQDASRPRGTARREPSLGPMQQPVQQQVRCAWPVEGTQTSQTGHCSGGHRGEDGVSLSNLEIIH